MMTGNFTSIARPYAIAAFEFALEKNALSAWESMLQNAAMIAQDSTLMQLMASPEANKKQLANLFCELLTKETNHEMKNFILQLGEHNRFAVLPDIAQQFKLYRAEHEKKMTVDVISAVEINAQQRARLVQSLSHRLQREVTVNYAIDATLLGGLVIRAGDKVIDSSVRGKLNRLIEFI